MGESIATRLESAAVLTLTQGIRDWITLSQARSSEWAEHEKAHLDANFAAVHAEYQAQQQRVDQTVGDYMALKLQHGCTVASSEDQVPCPALQEKELRLSEQQSNVQRSIDKTKENIQNRKVQIEGRFTRTSLLCAASPRIAHAVVVLHTTARYDRRAELELQKNEQVEKLRKLRQSRTAIEAAQQTTLDDLTRGMMDFKTSLGLDFGKAPNNSLRYVAHGYWAFFPSCLPEFLFDIAAPIRAGIPDLPLPRLIPIIHRASFHSCWVVTMIATSLVLTTFNLRRQCWPCNQSCRQLLISSTIAMTNSINSATLFDRCGMLSAKQSRNNPSRRFGPCSNHDFVMTS
jgi:hypothetical protein